MQTALRKEMSVIVVQHLQGQDLDVMLDVSGSIEGTCSENMVYLLVMEPAEQCVSVLF